MGAWSRVGDASNPTAYRYTYSTKTDETTGNKPFSLKPYLFDSKFLNKINNVSNDSPMKIAKIKGVKVVYTVTSGYGGSWRVQGKFTYKNNAGVQKDLTSATSSSFIVNSDYKRIVQIIDFTETVDIGTLVDPSSPINFQILIQQQGYGTLHWHAESGMTTYIDLLVGTASGTTSSGFEIPEEDEEFRRFVDPIEVEVSSPQINTELTLEGSTSRVSRTKNIDTGTKWPIDFGVWPYEEQVTITYKANASSFTRNINIISEQYFNLNPSVYRMEENNNVMERKFDGECIELNLDFKISNNSFINNNNNVLNIEIYQESSLTPLYTTTYSITNTTENFIINIIPMLDETHYYKIAADEEVTLIVKVSLNDSNPTILLFTQAILISKAVPIFNIEENGVAIGQFSTGENNEKKFEVGYPTYFENTVQFNNHLSGAVFKGEIDCSEGIKGVTNFPDNDSTAQPIGYFGNNRVYRKVITYEFKENDATITKMTDGWYNIAVGTSIANAHYINAYGYISYGGSEFPINYYQSSTNFSMCYLASNQLTIHCQHGTNDKPIRYMIVFIYYIQS